MVRIEIHRTRGTLVVDLLALLYESDTCSVVRTFRGGLVVGNGGNVVDPNLGIRRVRKMVIANAPIMTPS